MQKEIKMNQDEGGIKYIKYIGFFSIVSILFSYIFLNFMITNNNSDISSHINYAEQIKSLSDIYSPHFLFQIAIKIIAFVTDVPLRWSAAILLGVCYGAMAVMIARRIIRDGSNINLEIVFVITLFILVASHIFIGTMFVPNFYHNYLVPITYHNPTQQLNKVFAVAIWFIYCDLTFSKRSNWAPAKLALLSALCVASALAKPSFLIAFLPISGVIALFDLWHKRWHRVLGYALAMVPVTLVLLWQFGSHYGSSAKGGIVFAPLVVFSNPLQYLLALPMSLAFPIVTTICFWKDARRSRSFRMAWVFMFVALFYALFLAEAKDLQAGNFAWTAQTGAFLLYVESLLLVMQRRSATGRFAMIPVAVLAVHVACGFIFAGASAFWPRTAWQ